MSTPENSSPVPPETSFSQAEALEKLGRDRANSRTTLRDREGVLEQEHERTAEDKLIPRNEIERGYRQALVEETQAEIRQARAERENGLTEKEAMAIIRERILDSQLERMQAEIHARSNPETIRGKLTAKFTEIWRNNPKTRRAITVGLIVVGVGSTALGIGGVGVAAGIIRAGMSGAGGYFGAKDAMEVGSAYKERRKGIFGKFGTKGDKEPVTVEQAAEMSSDERVRRMTALLSAGVLEGKGPNDENHPDKAAYDALRQAEAADIDKDLAEARKHYWGKNFWNKKGVIGVLDRRVSEQMKAEHDRLKDDKKANRRRTAIAAGIGTALAGYGLFGHGDILGGGDSTEGAGGVDQAQEQLHRAGDSEWGSSGEIYTPADYILDEVNGDESKLDAVTKHLENIQEYQNLDPAAKSEVLQELANNNQIMEVVNEDGVNQWRIPKSALEQSIFNHK